MRMQIATCFVLFLLPAFCAGSESPLIVNSECVNDKAQGSYEVKTQSGQVRISGHYADGGRDGDFTFYDQPGNRIIVLPYRKGFIHGTVTAWHSARSGAGSEPQLKLVSDIEGGFVIGRYQTWYANGVQRSSFELENGVIKSAEIRDTDGAIMDIKAQSEFLNADIESDFSYYQQLEQVLDAFPPQC